MSLQVPMVDLKQQYKALKAEIDSAILNTLENAQFILGPEVQQFEKSAAEYLSVKHTIGVASGTDALHLALLGAGIKPGDEVITSPFTFIASAEAISFIGATPVFVDIDPDTFNLNLGKVEKAITDQTKAVLPVHLFGQPVDMGQLIKICARHNLKIIEDCAQSFGAHINGKQTGSFGEFGAFSFFPSKNLGCYGDGGLVSTDSDELAEKIKILRNHGMSARYHHTTLGFNSRLDEMQAAILNIKLKRLDSYNQKRRQVAANYKDFLSDTNVLTPKEDGIGLHIYHQFVCLHSERDKIIRHLQDNDIACAIYYPIPLHQQTVYAKENKDTHLPHAEAVARQCFALPVYPEMDDAKIKLVTDTIKSAVH